MALLASRTINAVVGRTYVSLAGTGIGFTKIVCIKREGTQYDEVASADLNNGVTRQYSLNKILQRVNFPTTTPFLSGEKVFVIYKGSAL